MVIRNINGRNEDQGIQDRRSKWWDKERQQRQSLTPNKKIAKTLKERFPRAQGREPPDQMIF